MKPFGVNVAPYLKWSIVINLPFKISECQEVDQRKSNVYQLKLSVEHILSVVVAYFSSL